MGRLSAAAQRSSLANPDPWLTKYFGGGDPTPAGVHVNEDTALHYGPFFAGIRIISEDVASLPFPVYRRLSPRGKERDRSHRLYEILNDAPNPLMSAMAFRETLQGHALTWAGGYAEIVRNNRGDVEAVWPLRPDRMQPRLVGKKKRQLVYRYLDSNAGINTTFLADQILHIHGLGFNGVKGFSIVELARNSIGLGLAAEQYGAGFFGNAARPSGVLTHPGQLTDNSRKNMRDSWERLHRGPTNAQRIAILEEGVTWQSIGIPPGDAQFLDTRRFEVVDMARWLRLPPHKLGELGRATWGNIESEQIDYVSSALRAWLERWEAAVTLRLLTGIERRTHFAEHLVDALLRGDTKTRMEAYRIGREIGLYNADDLAEMENRNPLPDGKGQVYMVPLNWIPAPSPDDDGGNDPFRQKRAARSLTARRRIADAFKPLLSDVDERIARRERNAITKLIKTHLGDRRRNDLGTFRTAIDDLYEGDILEQTIARWTPVLGALAAEIATEAAAEIGLESAPDLDAWIVAYVAAHSAYRIGSAKRQVLAIVDTPGLSITDMIDAITAHLDDVVDTRPERAAQWEATQTANGATRETWRGGGVTKLAWSSSGPSCPYCSRLDGKVVGIEQPFAAAGDTLEGGEGDDPIQVGRNTFTPPIHPRCNCSIVST